MRIEIIGGRNDGQQYEAPDNIQKSINAGVKVHLSYYYFNLFAEKYLYNYEKKCFVYDKTEPI